MIVLGFSVGSDRGASIIKDNSILISVTDSKLSKVKNDGVFSVDLPEKSILHCLEECNLSFSDIDYYVYTMSEVDVDISKSFVNFTKQPKDKLKFIPHHLAHAFSSFHSSGYSNAMVLVSDGIGSIISKNNQVEKWYDELGYNILDTSAENYNFAESVSLYYFSKNSYEEVYKNWVKYPLESYNESDSLNIELMFGMAAKQLTFNKLEYTFDKRNLTQLSEYDSSSKSRVYELDTYDGEFKIPFQELDGHIRYDSADFMGKCKLASTYQNEHTELALDLIDYLSKYYVSNSLCLAGSVFSNPKTFTKVYKRIPFDRIYAPPFLEDDGLSIGCAWWAFVKYSNRPSNIEFNSSVGKQYTSDEILKDLQFIDDVFSNDILDRYELLEFNNDADLSKNVATLLKQNKIVGIFKGKCDSGYTSLGNRSILANPTSRITTDYILRFVKEDEWYVKYGVSILDTKINQVFENDIYSPYMLVQSKVKNNWKYKAPGLITAQDNLLYHSVMQSRNPFLFDVISNFNTLCDVPMVLNVNLSSKNDPMDYTPYDAIKTMYTKKLSALVLENMMLVQKQLL
jgi:carbamoyltransferase